jgi:uncharacterized protein (UPF0332 family)
MTWKDLLAEGRIEELETSRKEFEDLRAVVARDLADAEIEGLSPDRKFATAYNAALQSAKMVIRSSGYRVRGWLGAGHYVTFECLKLAMGKSIIQTANFLDRCRRKRNIADYDLAGAVTAVEAEEMLKKAKSFAKKAEKWIRDNHPKYG